jgi:hypothetical protein
LRNNRLRHALLAASGFFVVALGHIPLCRAAVVALYADEYGTNCTIQQPPLLGTASVYALLQHNPGSTGVQFKVAPPSCAEYQLSGWDIGPLVSIGDPENGIAIGLGGCVAGDVILMRLDYDRLGDPSNCCVIRLHPHPDALTKSVEVLDCAFVPHSAQSSVIWLRGDDEGCPPVPAPSNPSPPDGAIDVALDQELNAELHGAEYHSACVPLGSDWVQVYLGVSPDPPLVGDGGPLPFPTHLEPATKYYWKVVYWANGVGYSVSSPVWGFTTSNDPNPVSKTTWGRIKSLYR